MKEMGRICFLEGERVDCVSLKSVKIKKNENSANDAYWNHEVCTHAHWYEIIQIFQQYSFYFVALLVFLV